LGTQWPALSTLVLRSTVRPDVPQQRIAALVRALECAPTLIVLKLSGLRMGDLGGTELGMALLRLLLLQRLDASNNRIGTAGFQRIAAGTKGGAANVAGGLQTDVRLRELRLGGNEARDAGTAAVAAVFHALPALEVLDLSSNGLGTAGAHALVDHLHRRQRLMALDVSGNAWQAPRPSLHSPAARRQAVCGRYN
jgi:Ran GTPase-activating protein (RanGAP) involved in mRNA processing and transport